MEHEYVAQTNSLFDKWKELKETIAHKRKQLAENIQSIRTLETNIDAIECINTLRIIVSNKNAQLADDIKTFE